MNNRDKSQKSAMQELDEYTKDPSNHLYQFIENLTRKVEAACEESRRLSAESLESIKKENEEMKNRLSKAESYRERYRRERNELRDKIERFSQEVKNSPYYKNVENLRHDLEDLRKLYKEKETEWEQKMKKSEQASAEIIATQKYKIDNCEKQIKLQEKLSRELLKKIEDSRYGLTETVKLRKQLEESQIQLKETKERLQRVSDILKDRQKELDDTKTRLSIAMGHKLTDNNPNIADLSDKDRPTKLAEKYAELYDNQWCDAFEHLERYFTDDEKIIEILLDILLDIDDFCKVRANKQLEELKRVILCSSCKSLEHTDFPNTATKQLKDCRKATSSMSKDNVFEMYLSNPKLDGQNLKYARQIKTFVRGCVEICWPMALQDPPVVFGPVAKYGEPLRTEIYKAYVQSGPYIKYVVWPSLLLHKGGPILAKGVAQGLKGRRDAWSKSLRREPKIASGHIRIDSGARMFPNYGNGQNYTTASTEPSADDMKLFFYLINRSEFDKAREVLGDVMYEKCWERV